MRQTAPDPGPLASLVERVTYKPGWMFFLRDIDRDQGCEGLTLIIRSSGQDSNEPERTKNVLHFMPVPAAAYNERSWQRWLFEQVLLVEQHEAAEFFKVEGERPYQPNHGPGNDPYTIRELTTDEERRTTFRGQLVD